MDLGIIMKTFTNDVGAGLEHQLKLPIYSIIFTFAVTVLAQIAIGVEIVTKYNCNCSPW